VTRRLIEVLRYVISKWYVYLRITITCTIAIFFDKPISCTSTKITGTNEAYFISITLHMVTYPRQECIFPNFPYQLQIPVFFRYLHIGGHPGQRYSYATTTSVLLTALVDNIDKIRHDYHTKHMTREKADIARPLSESHILCYSKPRAFTRTNAWSTSRERTWQLVHDIL